MEAVQLCVGTCRTQLNRQLNNNLVARRRVCGALLSASTSRSQILPTINLIRSTILQMHMDSVSIQVYIGLMYVKRRTFQYRVASALKSSYRFIQLKAEDKIIHAIASDTRPELLLEDFSPAKFLQTQVPNRV
jgi:hypothetical protein